MVKSVRLKDIAENLGISVNSVSRALRNCSDISEETKKRVQEKALEMGYVPNGVASSLRNGKTNLCTVVFDNLLNPYFNIMAHYIEEELHTYGYDMTIYTCGNTYLDEMALQKIISRKGEAVLTFLQPTAEAVHMAVKYGLPLILVGRDVEDFAVDVILTDDIMGGRLAAEYLIKQGAKRLVYVGSMPPLECSDRRFKGAEAYAKKHEVEIIRKDLWLNEESYEREVEELLSYKPDSLFVFNDQNAFTILRYLYQKKIRVPEEIKIVGYDNLSKEMVYPLELTTIGADKRLVAKTAVASLMKKIEGGNGKIRKIIDVKLIQGATA